MKKADAINKYFIIFHNFTLSVQMTLRGNLDRQYSHSDHVNLILAIIISMTGVGPLKRVTLSFISIK